MLVEIPFSDTDMGIRNIQFFKGELPNTWVKKSNEIINIKEKQEIPKQKKIENHIT